MASRSEILNILETRYDHYSARIVFKDVLENAKLESKAKYEPSEVTKIANALIRTGARVERVVDRIRSLDAGKSAKAAPKPKDDAPAAQAEAPAEAPAEAAKSPAPAKKAKKSAKNIFAVTNI